MAAAGGKWHKDFEVPEQSSWTWTRGNRKRLKQKQDTEWCLHWGESWTAQPSGLHWSPQQRVRERVRAVREICLWCPLPEAHNHEPWPLRHTHCLTSPYRVARPSWEGPWKACECRLCSWPTLSTPLVSGLWKHCPTLFPAHPGISPQLNVCLSLHNKPDIQVQHSTFVGYFLYVG